MGRSVGYAVGTMRYEMRDRGTPGKTVASVVRFAITSDGPVASKIQDYLGFDARGQYFIDADKVQDAADAFQRNVVLNREYDRKYVFYVMVESYELKNESKFTGGPRAIRNALNRDGQAESQAILAAADAGGVKLTPYQKRVLKPSAEGRYLDVVYGEKGQFEEGTLVSRIRAQRRPGAGRDSSDSAARARAEELRQTMLNYQLEGTRFRR